MTTQQEMALALAPFVAPRLLSQAATAALQAAGQDTLPSGTVEVQPRCKALGRGDTQCIKQGGHDRRHQYGPRSVNPSAGHRAPPRQWEKIPEFKKPSPNLQRTYTIAVGYPCKVEGQRGVWKVVSIERHRSTGMINVEVTQDRTGHSRTFPSTSIVYKRPPKGT